MENVEKIELPFYLEDVVAQELKDKHGVNKERENVGHFAHFRFTQEELSKITELKLTNPVSGRLEGVELLPNLRRLYVESTTNDEYTASRYISSIGDKDVCSIEKCKNLEILSIINQSNITEIDLSQLTKLKELNINKNTNLETIDGLDKLKKLESLSCYGNISLQNIENLDKAIIQNKDNLIDMNLDVQLFPKAIGYKVSNGSYSQEAMDTIDYVNGTEVGNHNVMWYECLNRDNIKISTYNMLQMHNKACQILHDILPRNSSTFDAVVAVERYLAEKVTYDDESRLNGRVKSVPMADGMRLVTGHKNGINGAYDCLVEHSCVCQGYTRGEQYLLGLRGIKTREVSCYAGKDTLGFSDSKNVNDVYFHPSRPKEGYHSIIRIDDNYYLYSDPCWNACHYQAGDKSMPYTLLTKEEIRKDHILSFQESNVANNAHQIKRSRIEESLQYNTLFRNSRTSEVNAQRATLQQDVRGIVRGADGRAY